VAICWLPGGAIGNVAFLRLLRLMRLLKLVGKVKQLQVIVQGLAKGLGSVVYIVILMILVFYLYAVLGVQCFRKNDPFHFGGLGIAMVSLFRAATKENWTHLLVINEFGCDSTYFGANGNYYGLDGGSPTLALGHRNVWYQTKFGSFPLNVCWHPKPQPMLASVFFVSFALIAGFVMLSLFVGAVCGGMGDALDDFKAKEEIEKLALNKRTEAENAKTESAESGGYSINALRDAFEACDEDASGAIDAAELVQAMRSMGEQVTRIGGARSCRWHASYSS
jgi:voltage-gated sodium channel